MNLGKILVRDFFTATGCGTKRIYLAVVCLAWVIYVENGSAAKLSGHIVNYEYIFERKRK